jgi:membrane fusion protein (multidrug efflux system)
MNFKLKRHLKIIITIFIIIGIAFYYFHKSKNASAGPQGGMPPTPVKTAIAKTQNWPTQIQATGTLNPEQGIMLKAETSGRITQIFFTSGQEVKAGDPLIEINPAILKAQLNAAVAKANLSKGNYERALKLYERKVLSQQDLDTALSNQKSDEANVEQYKAQLTQNIIKAPINGKMGLRLFNLGDYIQPGQALVNLQSINPLRVDFSIPENKISILHIDNPIRIHADAYPDEAFSGKVSGIDSAIDSNTRSIAVRGQIANPEGKLLPGNFVQVTLLGNSARPFVTVPQTAIVYDAASNYVYVIVKNQAVKKNIEIAEQNESQVALKSGLHEGEIVITEGQLKIGEGAPVNAIH